jgi:carboxylesterase
LAGSAPAVPSETLRNPAGVPTDPFLWPAGPTGCLLVHGLTGTPYEMRFLGTQLHAAGYTVHGVCLAGHATTVHDLEACSWRDWYRSVEVGLETLHAHCARTVAVGLSLGGLLIARLGIERAAGVDALVLLAPALRLANPWPTRLEWVLRSAWPLVPRRWRYRYKPGSDIRDPEARQAHPGYRQVPLRSVLETLALQRLVRAELGRVAQPTLALHGGMDRTVSLESLELVRRALPNLRGSVVLPASGHVITVDAERARVAEEITRFAAGCVAVRP